ncbi:hypothetical protein GN244_ATG15830 [Phytophthora infestans]|uniref:Bzip transcription factor n=1 Tax=Phytophthora infestans TaxID=4787 RepID=A0A833SUL1_PHYIN|nr:hypothetical protein GN244_ATG15830 [Phytophthora infestans]KAF4147226.1 hypothetical protein GN958_ATG03636 [Phytophthora infestans]
MLRPPTRHTMSEDVIGAVAERRRSVHHTFVGEAVCTSRQKQQSYCNEPAWSSSSRIPQTGDRSSAIPHPLTMQEIGAIADQDTLSELRSILKDRRDRRKIIQQRHLKKKQKTVENLVESIPKLRTEIEQLQVQRLSLRERLPKENVWFVAVEYFRVFQFGFPKLDVSQTRAFNFLSASMAPDLRVDTGISSGGIDTLIQNWKVFPQAFPGGHIRLNSLKQLSAETLIGMTNTTVTLTKDTLLYLFPSLGDGSSEMDERRRGIFARLLNQRIVLPGSVRFAWDESSKRVIGLFSDTDLLTPMMDRLGRCFTCF